VAAPGDALAKKVFLGTLIGDSLVNLRLTQVGALIVVVINAANIALASSVWAKDSPAPPSLSTPKPLKITPKPARPASADSEYRNQRILTPIPLPDIPQYTGQAKLINGFHYPNETGGQAFVEVFGVLEEPAQVYQWYAAALKNFGWSIVPTQGHPSQDGQTIDASKATNNVFVQVRQSHNPLYRTELTIKCKLGKAM
jgi:hypothetical protein